MPALAREVEETNELAFGVKRRDYGCLDRAADEPSDTAGMNAPYAERFDAPALR